MPWQLIKKLLKLLFVVVCCSTFCWNSFCLFCNFILFNYQIPNTSFKFNIFVTTCCRIPKTSFFAHTMFFFRLFHSRKHLSLFNFWFKLHFLPSNLHSHLNDICFINVLDSFIYVIILKTCKFKSSISFGAYTLLDHSSRVL